MNYAFQTEWTAVLQTAGCGGYPEYRIPGIVITAAGTILCCCEARTCTHSDWGKIDLLIARSADDGKTWQRTIISLAETLNGAPDDTINNPTLTVDGNIIHLIFHQNYARAFHCISTDDGISWSEPDEITDAFRKFPLAWNCCATGPGHGLTASNGRIIAPVWIADGAFLDPTGRVREHFPSSAGAIYSDDRGKTWHAGTLVAGVPDANETTVAELSDGRILFNFRMRSNRHCRALAVSPDGVSGYEHVSMRQDLYDPMCFGSMVNLPGGIAFVNCGGKSETPPLLPDDAPLRFGERTHITVKISTDDGQTWHKCIDVDPVGGYADIAAHGDSLYVFYEQTSKEKKIVDRLILRKYRFRT